MFTLQTEALCKHFASKAVLQHVSVSFEAGSVYALLGENGAGKSTLAALLTGSLEPTSGAIIIDGERRKRYCEHDAQQAGIRIVHQRPLLAQSLSARENIVLGAEPQFAFGIINRRKIKNGTDALLRRTLPGLELPLDVLCANLNADMRFFTAYLAALWQNCRLLILDEPTAALDTQQTRLLYDSAARLAKDGTAILLITHNIREAAAHADTILILQHGVVSDCIANKNRTVSAAAIEEKLMQDRTSAAPPVFAERAGTAIEQPQHAVFAAERITARPKEGAALFDVSFSVLKAEVTLIEGQRENGLQLLEDVITGMYQDTAEGHIYLHTDMAAPRRFNLAARRHSAGRYTCGALRSAGAAIIPFDRTYRASHPALTAEQVCTAAYAPADPRRYTQNLIEQAQIQAAPDDPVSSLSGGMLQRLILERELALSPPLLLLSDPLHGLDTAKAQALAVRLWMLAQRCGTAVIILAARGQYPTAYCTHRFMLSGGTLTRIGAAQLQAPVHAAGGTA